MLTRFFRGQCRIQSFSGKKAKFSSFQNPESVNTAIIKHKKNIIPETFSEILNACKEHRKIQLFKITWFTKLFFLVSRYQILGYCIGGGLYSFYVMHEKWEKVQALEAKETKTKKEQKEISKIKQKMLFGGIALILCGIFGTYLTMEMGKRLIKTIYWLPKENKFELNYFSFFGFNKPIIVSPGQLTKLPKPRRFDSTIVWEMKHKPKGIQLLSTKGTGRWIDKDIFEYIITKYKPSQN